MSDSPPLAMGGPITTMPLLLGEDRVCYVIDERGDPLISTSLSPLRRRMPTGTSILERWRISARTKD
jgi:hypothetical protein